PELARDRDEVAGLEEAGETPGDPLGRLGRVARQRYDHGRAPPTARRSRALTLEETELDRFDLEFRRRGGRLGYARRTRHLRDTPQQIGNPSEVLLEHLQHRRGVERRRRMIERVETDRPRTERDLLLDAVYPGDTRRPSREQLRREVPE